MPGAISSSRALPALLHHRFLLRGADAVGGLTSHRLTSATPEDSRNRTVTSAFSRERDFFLRRPADSTRKYIARDNRLHSWETWGSSWSHYSYVTSVKLKIFIVQRDRVQNAQMTLHFTRRLMRFQKLQYPNSYRFNLVPREKREKYPS